MIPVTFVKNLQTDGVILLEGCGTKMVLKNMFFSLDLVLINMYDSMFNE